jgi:hypothetical protein
MANSHDIETAARRIAGRVRHTPVLHLAKGELGLGVSITLGHELIKL